MTYQLAQINIAEFRQPKDHPDNSGFIDNLDRVNAVAESSPGFIWRLIGDDNNAMDVDAYDDENTIVNISVWRDIDALAAFAYRNPDHREIFRQADSWFTAIEVNLALWWVEEGHRPTAEEAKERLAQLRQIGPSQTAFTFKNSFPPPS